jgi:hypothetical protein
MSSSPYAGGSGARHEHFRPATRSVRLRAYPKTRTEEFASDGRREREAQREPQA